MCGFFITNSPYLDEKKQLKIKEAIKFRGPDFSSEFIAQNGWAAHHSRLSIIGMDEKSNQPFIDKNGGVLVFNGEILNYKELGEKYFQSTYDSDTILLSDLITTRNLCLTELDGFFAFVYVDENGVLKHAVRDRFGVKPLFYRTDCNGIAFSSEPKALLMLKESSVSEEAVEEYRCLRAPMFSGSYFTDIKEVNPGTCYINGTFFDVSKWMTESYESFDLSKLKTSIEAGIDSRQVSDAPIGLLLSKGIDSNLIDQLTDFDKRYSIGFSGDEDYEHVKENFVSDVVVYECTANEYKDAFEHLLSLRGEPMSVPNEVLLYLIAKRAKSDGVKVLLSGEGADEFFGGYDRIFSWAHKVKTEFNLDDFLDLYTYHRPESNGRIYKIFDSIFAGLPLKSAFEKVRYFFIRYHMPVLFRRLDFALMAAGVEGREPIANMHVLNAALKISPDDLMVQGLGKSPLRQLICQYLGENFAYDKKVGFPVNLKAVFDVDSKLDNYEIWFNENIRVLR